MAEEPKQEPPGTYLRSTEREFLPQGEKGERPPEELKEGEAELERRGEVPAKEMPEDVIIPTPHSLHISEEIEKETKQIKKLPQERQIQALVDLALHKGLRHSIDTARALNNPYILDQFHDMLVGHLYKELVEKGKLKEL